MGLALRDGHQGSCGITSLDLIWECYLFGWLSCLLFHLLQIFGAAAHVLVSSRTQRRVALQHPAIRSWCSLGHFTDIPLLAIIGHQSWPSAESMIVIHFLRQRLEMCQLQLINFVTSSKVPPVYVCSWLIASCIIYWRFKWSILLNSGYRCHWFIIVVLSTLTFQCLQLMSVAKVAQIWSCEHIARFWRFFGYLVGTFLLLFKLISEL